MPAHLPGTQVPTQPNTLTPGQLPAAQVEMSGRLAVWGSDKQIMPCQTMEVGRAGKGLERLELELELEVEVDKQETL